MFNKGWQPKEYKGVHDEIKQQHMKTKDMSFKGKLAYFWEYYKVHTIVTILVIFMGITLIHDVTSAKDTIFYGVMLNSAGLDGEAIAASFGEYAELDLETYNCMMDTTSTFSYRNQTEYDYATNQKLVASIQVGELDVLVEDAQVFDNFALNGMYMDLREAFSKEELAAYEGNIYYVDHVEMEKRENVDLSDEEAMLDYEKKMYATAEEIAADAEAHKYPETMEEPIPVGIFIGETPMAIKTGCYPQSVPIYGIVITCKRTDTAKKYLDYLLDESIPFEEMMDLYDF